MFWTILIGAGLLAAAGAWGLAKVAEWVVPMTGGLAVLGLGVFVVVVIPLSLVQKWRPRLAGLAQTIASGFGVGVWMVSFLTLWKWLGFFALPAIFLPFLAAPLAILRLAFLLDWNQAAGIAMAAVLAQGMRSYAYWLSPPFMGGFGAAGFSGGFSAGRRGGPSASPDNGDVIDTVIVEPREEPRKELP